MILCKDRADLRDDGGRDDRVYALLIVYRRKIRRHDIQSAIIREKQAMRLIIARLTIEIVAAALLVVCISATSAAFAAGGKAGRSADGLSCAFSVPANATPAARCAAIRRQCGGKFTANYCGDKMLSAM
jgi:ABC-type dipeptide/oligopeptide/nickel transport system permease component